ncbi:MULTISPECIES: GNAT family N-acetyltransferase [unclassified Streptomyces]|uniref:GNAT family N-acetyltransferase n=1 Tax=unclassified Streptomyces TaxID=2593676 RepID=UPI001E40EC35|nr:MULTISPECIES: GNAT family N-acetyltransferase [unclassified Streptomyces]MDU0304779.1 GNAT family N-acetyltransferase [Streptomyces sp. PAL114]
MRILAAQALSTRRPDLLPLRVEHAEEMAAVLSDPALHTFTGGAPDTARALRSRCRRMTAGSPDPATSWLNWVIRLRDESCLTDTVQATVGPAVHGPIAEIAWVVGTPWQGKGIAVEAARGLVYWLSLQPVHTVITRDECNDPQVVTADFRPLRTVRRGRSGFPGCPSRCRSFGGW